MAVAITGDPNGVLESYPQPTIGVGIPEKIIITGAGVVAANQAGLGPEFKVEISLHGQASVQLALTGSPVDAYGNGCNAGVVNWKSYNTVPASLLLADPNALVSAYPPGAPAPAGAGYGLAPQYFAGGCTVNSSGVVTVVAEGHYWVEAQVIAGAPGPFTAGFPSTLEASQNTKSGFVYGYCMVKVTA
jgi:hypothetical protein